MAIIRYLHLGLTAACNLNCKHCFIKEKDSKELSFEKAIAFIDVLEKQGLTHIYYTYGEPLLYHRLFTEFFDNVEKSASEISVTMAYEITMKSTISTAIIVLESEGRLEERYWNHLRVQNNILDFLYDLWVGSCHSLAADFSTIMKDLVEYDFIITESIMRERMQSA